VQPAVAADGATLTAQYQATETLAGAPTLTVTLPDASDGSALFGAPVVSGLSYTWSYPLQPGDQDGTWAFAVSGVQDLAGNSAGNASGSAVVDQTAPSITVSNVTPLLANASTSVTVTFTASETQAGGFPTLRIGGVAVAPTLTGGNSYTATTTLGGADGTKAVEVGLRDLAGNSAFVSLDSVALDTTINNGTLTVQPAVASDGATLTAQYQATEVLTGPPTLTVTLPDASDGSALFGAPVISGLSYTWSYPLQP